MVVMKLDKIVGGLVIVLLGPARACGYTEPLFRKCREFKIDRLSVGRCVKRVKNRGAGL